MYPSGIVSDLMKQRVKDLQKQAAADRRAARAKGSGKAKRT